MSEKYEDLEKLFKFELINKILFLQQEKENLRATIKNDDITVNRLCEELSTLKQQLKDKDEKISKVVEHCFRDIQYGRSEEDLWLMGYYDNSKDILEILESE